MHQPFRTTIPWRDLRRERVVERCFDVVDAYLARRGESLWWHHERQRQEAASDEADREISAAFPHRKGRPIPRRSP